MRFRGLLKDFAAIIHATLLVSFSACSPNGVETTGAETNLEQGNIRYFGSWASYKIPFKPQEPLTEAEAKSRDAYYVGEYNSKGQLVMFKKYLHGELEWSDHYTYWENGELNVRRMLEPDGTKKTQIYDEKGRLEK